MDWNHSPEVSARRAALCKRHGGPGMGGDCAAPAATEPPWPAAHDRSARRGGRDLLYCPDRLPVAAAAEGLPALHDGAEILLSVARRRHLAAHQPRTGDARARG